MEILQQLVEVGVVGLAAYMLMIVSSWLTRARRSGRDSPDDAPVALAVAAAAVAFLVLSTLFDIMSFPHVPYIFLWLAGLLAMVVRSPDERRGSEGVR